MATDYISREEAIKYIKDNQCKDCSDIGLCGKCSVLTALKLLENVPAADVRPVVRGEWVEDDYGFIHCSFCGMEWDEPEHPKTNFCPSCGADTREIEP